MFSSTNPFGQSSSSPFGSPSVFGQTNNASNNPFAPKPFGSSTPFGSQTGGSLFGGTSSGVFGVAQSSPFSSTTTFGASSSPAFGNTMPAFGASSTPAFGSSSSSFGGSSVFGQKPAFGGFGSSPTQTSPFESTNQQSQPAFGSSIFGASTPFGAISQPAFGASSTPAFGATSAPALFGTDVSSFSIGSSVFGQKPAFGGFGSSPTQTGPFGSTNQQSQPVFGSSIFGASTPFGATSQPAFGATSAPAFGSTNSPAFGATSTPGTPSFGGTSTPPLVQQRFLHLGMQGRHLVCQTLLYLDLAEHLELQAALCLVHQVPLCLVIQPLEHLVHQALLHLVLQALLHSVPQVLLGASSTPSFSFGSSPAFGQSASAFGSSPFGIITPFAAQSSPFAGFGQSPFGSQRGGSRVAAFTPTTEADGGKLESISAMPVYKDKSHEELRWEDFGQSPFGSQRGGSRVAPFTPTTEADDGKLESISAVPVYKDKSHEELRWEDYQIGDKGGPLPAGQPVGGIGFSSSPANSNLLAPSPPFGQSAANPFSTSMASNPFAPKTPSIGALNFGSSATPTISSSPFGASTSSGLFGSTSLSTSSTFGVGPSPSIFGSPFGSQRGGSRVAAFTPTEADDGKLESISAMPVYEDKCHEELRWEDYQIGDKGGPLPAGQPVGGIGFSSSPANSNLLAPPTFGQSAASPFSTSMTSNPFAPKTPSICALNFGSSATPTISSSPFGASTSSDLFRSTSSSTSSTFGVGPSPSIFGSSSLFSSSQATNGGFGSNTQSSPLFQSNAPSIGQTGFAFGQTTTSYGQNTSSPLGQGILGASTTPRFGVNTFLSTSSLISSSNALGFGQSNPSQPAQTTTGFGLSSFRSTQPAGGSPFGGMPGILGQSNIGQFAVGVGGVCKTPFKRSKVEVGSGRVR